MQTRIYNMRRSQGHSHYIKWVCVVLIQCPQGLFKMAARDQMLTGQLFFPRGGMSFVLLLIPYSSFTPSIVNYFLHFSLLFHRSLCEVSLSTHTYIYTQTLSLSDGLCLSISLQWPSYKAGVWRFRPAADAAVDWPFICSLQTVLNSH